MSTGRTTDPLAAVKTAQPFAALISASSLLVGLLFVAGFSYRWAYYYNFGVQHLVWNLTLSSFLVTSLELVRSAQGLVSILWYVLVPLIAFNLLLFALQAAASRPTAIGRVARTAVDFSGLGSPLVVDLLRAAIIVFAVSRCGFDLGYQSFRTQVADTPTNPLPRVTLLFQGEDAQRVAPVSCGSTTPPAALIGDGQRIDLLRRANRTCNKADSQWRLLYRDAQFIYVFASVAPQTAGARPLTLVLPVGEHTILVME